MMSAGYCPDNMEAFMIYRHHFKPACMLQVMGTVLLGCLSLSQHVHAARETVEIPSDLAPGDIVDIDFVDEDHGWLLVDESSDYRILRTTDGWTTWSLAYESGGRLGSMRVVPQFQFLDTQIGWFTPAGSFGEGFLFKTTDGGLTWTAQSC
jgi:photosystem II stability/assembly factor-like uncharacterized protein